MTGAGKNRGQGILRIYIDGSKIPVVSQTIRSFVGENKEVGYPLSSSVSPATIADERGHNLYLPIPYAKSCKITYQSDFIVDGDDPWKGEILYYNIDYRAYAEGVKIESFTRNSIIQNKSIILETNQMLLDGRFRKQKALKETDDFQIKLAPGEEVVIAEKEVGAAIKQLTLRIQEDTPTQSLRSIVIKCVFDNQQTVWAPIGDFPIKSKNNKEFAIPAVEILDKPAFEWRGFMLDESWHFFGKEKIKQALDFIAELKLNRFHWHLTDDQGWRIGMEKHPKLTEIGAWRVDYTIRDKTLNDWWGDPFRRRERKQLMEGFIHRKK